MSSEAAAASLPSLLDPAAQALRRAALAVAQPGGPTLFDDLIRELSVSLGAAVVFVAVFDDEACTRMRTLAVLLDGRLLRNFDYVLAGSPCAQVVGRDFVYAARGVISEFPPGSLFGAKGMDSYAAYPLNDSAGKPLGLLVAMDRAEIADPPLAEAMLKIVASRISAELERGQADEALRAAALAVSSARGASVFAELTRYLATILHVEVAFIARHDPAEPDTLRMLALWYDGQMLEDIRYPILHTPCATVLGQQFRVYPSRLAELFPEDDDVLAQGTVSYAGHPLAGLDGTALGIISIASRKPLVHVERVQSMLQIFAVRAAAEIERLRADETVRRSEAAYRAIFDAAEDGIVIHDWDSGSVIDLNPKSLEMSGWQREEVLGAPLKHLASRDPPYALADAERLMELGRQGRCPPFEWRRRNKDGSLHWDEVRLKPVVIGGEQRMLSFSRDITERKAAEQALRLREEQYRAVFDGSADALVLRDGETRVIDVNRAFIQMYGVSRDEALGSTYAQIGLSADDEQRRSALVRRALQGEESQLESIGTRKNGERFDIELRYLPIHYRGEPHVLVVTRDITARKAAEEALKLREEQYRAIFEASSDAFVLRDSQLRIVEVNPAFQRLYGFTAEMIAGESGYPAHFPPEYVESRRAQHRRALAGEETHVETVALRADGSSFEADMRVLPVRYRGEPHVLAVVRDITERKQAERALKFREEQYRAVFDGATDALVLWSHDVRIVDVNRAFTEMYGYTRDEVVGGSFGQRLSKEEIEQRMTMIERALAGEEAQFETSTSRRNGERFDVELRYLPIVHRGEPHVLAVSRDITARREAETRRAELEAQLRQAQKMEAIGQLTGGIAHDFNNILTSVIGYVVLASERAEPLGDPRLVRQLEQAHIAAQRARDLIAQMLTFARRQRGERRVLALPALVRQAVQLLRATLPSSIELDADTDAGAIAVEADPVQLEQVLFNLCINARDAIGARSGRIRVRLRETSAAGCHCASCRSRVGPGRWVELAVSDTGSGIAPDVQARMFDPFYTTKDVGRGSGMGLAMVHGIVHDHGGHLCVDTSPRGSLFRVLLPRAGAPAAASLPAAAAGKPSAAAPLGGRVLLVEDEPMVAEYMTELIDGWGFDVTMQQDAMHALEWLADPAHAVDLLITDQTMPRLTGMELAERVHAERPGLPVLLYTGNAAPLDADELRRCGVTEALRKPVDPDVLRAVVQRLVAGSVAASALDEPSV